jgi:DNA-binding winged helix-turn-helix (wHTH) protein/TolB-like protein
MESRGERRVVSFGTFTANLRSGELHCEGTKIHLQDQPFHVLSVLLGRAGELVTREELRHEVWPSNTFLEFDHALNTAIKKIRIALSDDAVAPRYVQTIPKRGYRWIAPVSFADALPADLTEPPRLWRAKAHGFGWGLLVALLVSSLWQSDSRLQLDRSVLIEINRAKSQSADPYLDEVSNGLRLQLIGRLAQKGVTAKLVESAGTLDSLAAYRNSSVPMVENPSPAYVLQLNVQPDPERLRVEAELIRTRDHTPAWRGNFDRERGDRCQMQAELAREIAVPVIEVLQASEQRESAPAASSLPLAKEPQ